MKRRIILSIALALSMISLALLRADSTAKAQPGGLRRIADTGIVTLGRNQQLRITVVNTDRNGNAEARFIQQSYTQEMCNGDGVCKLAPAPPNVSAPITLMPHEGASVRTGPFADGLVLEVRGVVLSNSRDVQVNAMIIDSTTGQVNSILLGILLPGI